MSRSYSVGGSSDAAFRCQYCSNLFNKPVFSFLRTLTTWHCPHSPAAAAVQRASRTTAANLQRRVSCCGPVLGQTDGQTDRRTPDRCIDPALCSRANNPDPHHSASYIQLKTFSRRLLTLRAGRKLLRGREWDGSGSPPWIADASI